MDHGQTMASLQLIAERQFAMIIPAIRFIPKHRREEPAGRMVEVRTMSIERFGLMESAVK